MMSKIDAIPVVDPGKPNDSRGSFGSRAEDARDWASNVSLLILLLILFLGCA